MLAPKGVGPCVYLLTLQEISCPPPHPRVDVRFRGLDVVVEIVTKDLDVRDDIFAALAGQVPWEENCSRERNTMLEIVVIRV